MSTRSLAIHLLPIRFLHRAIPYGVSKMEAEAGLRALVSETGMEVVIIRPPLVYGPGVKANFLAMMRWLQARYSAAAGRR